MKAIINSQYVIENVENFTLSLQNVFLEFKSEIAKVTALEQLKNLKYNEYSLTEVQFPANSGLDTISLFEEHDS